MSEDRRTVRDYLPSLCVYALIGGASAGLEWATFLAVTAGGADYRVAAVVAFVVATALNYGLSRRIGFFRRSGSSVREAAQVYLVSGLAFLPNMAVTVALVELLGTGPMLAKVAGTGAAFLFNFLLRQFWVFDRQPRWAFSGAVIPVRPR